MTGARPSRVPPGAPQPDRPPAPVRPHLAHVDAVVERELGRELRHDPVRVEQLPPRRKQTNKQTNTQTNKQTNPHDIALGCARATNVSTLRCRVCPLVLCGGARQPRAGRGKRDGPQKVGGSAKHQRKQTHQHTNTGTNARTRTQTNGRLSVYRDRRWPGQCFHWPTEADAPRSWRRRGRTCCTPAARSSAATRAFT